MQMTVRSGDLHTTPKLKPAQMKTLQTHKHHKNHMRPTQTSPKYGVPFVPKLCRHAVCLCYVSSSMSMCLLTVYVYVIAHMTQLLSVNSTYSCLLSLSFDCVVLMCQCCMCHDYVLFPSVITMVVTMCRLLSLASYCCFVLLLCVVAMRRVTLSLLYVVSLCR